MLLVGAGKSIKLNNRGIAINMGLVKCPSNADFQHTKVFPLSSLHVIIIGTIFSYAVGASGGNFSLFKRSPSGASSGYRLYNLCLGSKTISGWGCNKNVLVHILQKKLTRGGGEEGMSIPD